MLIQLNGKTRELPRDWSAEQLVVDLQLTGKRIAMELDCDGVLMNTAIASASFPIDGTIF